MTATTNAENLGQYNSIFFLIVEKILAFASKAQNSHSDR